MTIRRSAKETRYCGMKHSLALDFLSFINHTYRYTFINLCIHFSLVETQVFLEVFTRRMWSSIRRNGKFMGRDESGCDKNTSDLTQRYLMLQAIHSLQHWWQDWCKISNHYLIIFRDMLWLYRSITKIYVQLLQIAWVWCAGW